MFRDMFTSKKSEEDQSQRRTHCGSYYRALIRSTNIQSVLRDNVKFFREELGRVLDRYDTMRPLWDVRVVSDRHLDIPSCLLL